jgi:hypothetical protein
MLLTFKKYGMEIRDTRSEIEKKLIPDADPEVNKASDPGFATLHQSIGTGRTQSCYLCLAIKE